MQTRQPAHGLGPTKALGGSIWQGATGGYPWPSLSSAPGLRPGSTPHTCLSFVVPLHAKLTPNFSKLINFWKPGGIYGWSQAAAGAKVARRTVPPPSCFARKMLRSILLGILSPASQKWGAPCTRTQLPLGSSHWVVLPLPGKSCGKPGGRSTAALPHTAVANQGLPRDSGATARLSSR